MRYHVSLILLLLLTVLMPRTAYAQAVLVPPTKPSPQGQVAVMSKLLKLSDEQVTQLIEQVAAMRTAMTDWNDKHKDQLAKLNSDLEAAKAAGDRQQIMRLQWQQRALADERAAVQTDGQRKMLAILTPEQQITWNANQLLQQSDFAMVQKSVQLTPDQLAQLIAQARAYAVAQSKWEGTDGAKEQQLQQQILEAQTALATLMAEQDKLAAENHTAICALLTPDQQTMFVAAQVQQQVLFRLKNVVLTQDQLTKGKPLFVEAASEIVKLPANDDTARQQAMDKIYQEICAQVLTNEQRAQVK